MGETVCFYRRNNLFPLEKQLVSFGGTNRKQFIFCVNDLFGSFFIFTSTIKGHKMKVRSGRLTQIDKRRPSEGQKEAIRRAKGGH
jgi:hypothetical protein